LIYEAYIIYDFLPKKQQTLIIVQRGPDFPILINETNNTLATQFSQNMRFNHNIITYKIDPNCTKDKEENMLSAFLTISQETKIINFLEELTNPDISISCSEEVIQNDEYIYIAGEGGPSKYINNTIYPIILKGRILLYEKSRCKSPIVEMHELLHVFGFDHSKDKTDIMYPTTDCTQELKQRYIQSLIHLYSISPKAELYFEEIINITKSGKYLNFELTISNKGIINSEEVNLTVYSKNNQISSFSLGKIALGEGQRFTIKNLKLPSSNTNQITFKIVSETEEYDYLNNILVAETV
jgi:hypothetical protein